MIAKTRSDFMPTVEIEGIKERDLVNNHWHLFEAKRQLQYYNLNTNDIQRPDLISLRFYGIDHYWWVVMKFNQIDDVWNDIEEGATIEIPHIQDIRDFFALVKVQP